MTELVADVIESIRKDAPSSPFLLAGYSLGGFVALAIARNLAGTEIGPEAVFLIDTDSDRLRAIQSEKRPFARIFRLLRVIVATPLYGDPADLTDMLGSLAGLFIVRHPGLLRWAARHRQVWMPAGFRARMRFAVSSTLQGQLTEAYLAREGGVTAQRPSGPLLVILRAEKTPAPESTSMGVSSDEYGREIVETVAGDHWTLLRQRGACSLYKRLPEITRAGWIGEHTLVEAAPAGQRVPVDK